MEDLGSFMGGINAKLVRGPGLLSPTLGHTLEPYFILRHQDPQAFGNSVIPVVWIPAPSPGKCKLARTLRAVLRLCFTILINNPCSCLILEFSAVNFGNSSIYDCSLSPGFRSKGISVGTIWGVLWGKPP